MSKSKKNTIDPEKIIKDFGADAVRLFILIRQSSRERCSMVRSRYDSCHINLYKNFGYIQYKRLKIKINIKRGKS